MLKIRLSKLNDRGACAAIEGEWGDVTIAERNTRQDAGTVCKAAAKTLRRLADQFEKLAEQDEPFKCDTQDRLNAGRL